MTTLRLPTITVDIGESQAPPLPSVAHDIAIVGYYSGMAADGTTTPSPAVGTLSDSLHTRAAVQDFIGGTSPAYYAAAAVLSHVNPTSIHVLSLGDPGAPVDATNFAMHLEELANTSEVHLPDIFLMPGIAGKADGTALAVSDLSGGSNAYDDDDNVLLGGTVTVGQGDALYAAMDAYANAVNGIAVLEVPSSSVDNAFAFATENKDQNTLLVGNRMRFTHGPADFASPVGPIVGGILERELDPEYGRAAGVDYARITGVSALEWQLHHDLTDHTPTNDDTVRLVNNDVTVATRRGARFDIIGGTVGGYNPGDYRAYLGVLRATQHLQQLMLETNEKFAGRKDDGATLALAQSDFRTAYAPLIPDEFQSITLVPTNFTSDGKLEYEGEVEIYLPVKQTNVTLHLVAAEFQSVGP